MTLDRWQQVSRLYHAALEHEPSQRDRFLLAECGPDEALRQEVQSLLAQPDSAFLDRPPPHASAILPPDSPSSTLSAGDRLGVYEIRRLLGAGGMGVVYLAHDPRLRREVALKVLPAALAANPGRLLRFEQEARAAAALNHANIVAVHDIGLHDGVPFIVMECVKGETLAERLRAGRLPLGRAVAIGGEIATALAAAHALGVVHRDLKPGNVMLTHDGHVKVVDFGLAKVLDVAVPAAGPATDAPDTLTGQVLGTPGYMSPEQLFGRPIDHRSDLYNLRGLLFEMVTGQRPFAGASFNEFRRAVLTGSVMNPCDINPQLPPALGTLIARMMSGEPSERPDTAEQVRIELARFTGAIELPTAVTMAPPATPVTRMPGSTPRVNRTRYAAWGLVAMLAAAAAAIPWWRAQSPPAGEKPVIAVLPLTNLSGDQSKSYLGVGIADTLTNSLGQLSSITVVSRTVMQESGEPSTTDLAKVAKVLGATMLVQGSIQQVGDRLRVHANLVTPDGRVVWSGDSESRVSDLFSLESRLAGALIDALRLTLTGEERQRLDRPPTASRDALEAYWQGAALLEQSDTTQIDNAIDAFNRALAIDAEFSLAHANLGEAYRRKYLRTKEPEWIARAVAAASEALRLDPAQVDVRLSLAGVYRLTGRRGAAVEELRKALAQQPSNGEAHRQLGELLDAEGRPDEALGELRRAVAERPQYWRNYQSLGLFHYRRGNQPDAVAALTRLVELRPDDANPYQLLGAALLASGDPEQARDNFERSIALAPTPAAYSNLGTIHYSAKRYAEAVKAYEQAVRLAPNRAPFRRNLGDALLKVGRKADARAAYEYAVELAEQTLAVDPSDAFAMSQLAVYEAKIGRRNDAERHANAAVAINPMGPRELYGRAVVLTLNGDLDRALEAVKEAVSKGYSKQLALDDDDLAPLRPLPGFQSLATGK